jgi:riboflavin kinase / FMN adenylyltransferase
MALEVLRSGEEWKARFGDDHPTVVTIGNFDGVHRGHQKILRRVHDIAALQKVSSAVLTFYPHPARVLRPPDAPLLLMTLEQRLRAIEAMGIDAALVIRFDETLAKVTPEDFVLRFLVDTMKARTVLVGANFRFGHRGAGDAKLLAQLGQAWKFDIEIVPPVVEDHITVSSTAIRRAVREGRVTDAREMLGRPFSLEGEIKTGTGQGRKLVVPTLNLSTQQEVIPGNGVYATEVVVCGKKYQAATNVGMRPTFDGVHQTIESHLFDFNEELTSGPMAVKFWARLRDEKKFSSPEELKEQVLRDIQHAKEYFREAKLETREKQEKT